uniref:Uncharacterized protein n=1 Tax=uncultured marine virus TaxID=186617 RepID=A0A0F7L9U6_9VIRU|nr:hypothetical protein [uncultured marine virus]
MLRPRRVYRHLRLSNFARNATSASNGVTGVINSGNGSASGRPSIQSAECASTRSRNSVTHIRSSARCTACGISKAASNLVAITRRSRSSAAMNNGNRHRYGRGMSPRYASAASCNRPSRTHPCGHSAATRTECSATVIAGRSFVQLVAPCQRTVPANW